MDGIKGSSNNFIEVLIQVSAMNFFEWSLSLLTQICCGEVDDEDVPGDGELPDARAHRRDDERVAHEGRQDHQRVQGHEERVVGLSWVSCKRGAITSNFQV